MKLKSNQLYLFKLQPPPLIKLIKMAATDARIVTCCDPTGIEKQKQMMKDWDPSLLQVQLPYF